MNKNFESVDDFNEFMNWSKPLLFELLEEFNNRYGLKKSHQFDYNFDKQGRTGRLEIAKPHKFFYNPKKLIEKFYKCKGFRVEDKGFLNADKKDEHYWIHVYKGGYSSISVSVMQKPFV